MLKNYEDADEIIKPLAVEIIREETTEGQDFTHGARIKYLFKVNRNQEGVLGKCMKATGVWAFLSEYDFVISINKDFWDKASDNQKNALLYHELLHVEWREGTGKREGSWKIRKHDLEEFFNVVNKYGCWKEDLGIFRNVIKDKKLEGERD